MREYEINETTQLIKPIGRLKSIVYESECEYEVNKSSNSIIKFNCSFYGSSYIGRCEGTKSLTGIKSKFPIIVEESRKIIFFPTNSVRSQDTIWIALNHITNLKKDTDGCIIEFKSGLKFRVPVSFYSLNNQYCRATMLKAKLYERLAKEI